MFCSMSIDYLESRPLRGPALSFLASFFPTTEHGTPRPSRRERKPHGAARCLTAFTLASSTSSRRSTR